MMLLDMLLGFTLSVGCLLVVIVVASVIIDYRSLVKLRKDGI